MGDLRFSAQYIPLTVNYTLDIIKLMIDRFIKGRVNVFVDAANILYSQKTLRWRVDYEKLKKYFESECDRRAIYFIRGESVKTTSTCGIFCFSALRRCLMR